MPSSSTLRGSWLTALAVALVSLWWIPARPAASTTSPGAPASAAPASEASRDGPRARDRCLEGRRILEDYAALYAASTDPDASPARTRFQHAITLIPDPVVTDHTDYFDAVLEGVEEAIARGGTDGVTYVRDRSWLPWPGADSDKRDRACWEKQPGVVIYRPTTDPDRHPAFVLFLVGETPTWGLRRDAFEAALALADEFSVPGPAAARRHRVLGPTFSGTAPSLAAVMRRHLSEGHPAGTAKVTFDVSSGTATNPGLKDLLERAGAVEGHSGGPSSVTYWSATPNDDELLGAMLAYLSTRGGATDRPPCKIVMLSESLTAYGSAIGAPGSAIGTGTSVCWNGVKFPPNLRAVREAYEVASVATDGGAPRAPLDPATSPGTGGEYSDQTPAVHDLDLGEVLRELSDKRVRFVGLLATDARDVVFMAGRIRQQVPDIQLFTLGADIRYLHPTYARTMNGVLVAHASKVQPPDSWSTALEDEMVRNVYSAGRYLLTGSRVRGDVVISLIGNGALWQIGPDAPSPAGGPAPPDAPRAPMSWKFVFVLSLFVLLVIGFLVFAPALARAPIVTRLLQRTSSIGFLKHRGRLWSLVGPCEHVDLAAQGPARDRVAAERRRGSVASHAHRHARARRRERARHGQPRARRRCLNRPRGRVVEGLARAPERLVSRGHGHAVRHRRGDGGVGACARDGVRSPARRHVQPPQRWLARDRGAHRAGHLSARPLVLAHSPALSRFSPLRAEPLDGRSLLQDEAADRGGPRRRRRRQPDRTRRGRAPRAPRHRKPLG
jgi:hypothetical protein